MVRLVRAFNVGGSLTQLTVRRNEVLADTVPSLTVRVIVAVPNAFPAGVIVTVRLLLAPPKTMLVMGTRLESEEVAGSQQRSCAGGERNGDNKVDREPGR